MEYVIEGHKKLTYLRDMRAKLKTAPLAFPPGSQWRYGHLPSLDKLDNTNPRYTRLVDYA